jgi:hypothetical protein
MNGATYGIVTNVILRKKLFSRIRKTHLFLEKNKEKNVYS